MSTTRNRQPPHPSLSHTSTWSSIKENYHQGFVNQDQGSSTGGEQAIERWEDEVEISCELYWEIPINFDYTATGSPYASLTSRAKESITVDSEIMDIDSHTDETCHSEPIVLKKQTDVMEQALILDRDARIGNFHGFQRHSLGNSCGIPHVLRIMESKRGKNAHKRQGTAHSILRPQTQECGRSISVGLFRQHNHTCLRKEIWRNNFPRTSQDSRKDLESLSGNKYQTSGHLCTVGSQSRRCAEQTDCANRMVSITGGIQNTGFGLWSTRRRPVCIPHEQEGGSLLQLVPRHPVIRPECTGPQLKVPTRTITNNSGDTNVEVCYLVSRTISPVNLTAGLSASNDDHTVSKKSKVAALGKQASILDGLEDQRRFLESQGVGTYYVDCVLSNERRARRRSRYSSVQQ
ncbi:hypothetical protein AYI70_g1269 [Smittium culicis]|uniref:Uncharacterized protein n=1 Tax=Smittium culicis TaxID=133412 RepID=A0A1R1YDC5_9FUNG|nr:hypothetical protein AYI70_g1269 [Smittium culicis]